MPGIRHPGLHKPTAEHCRRRRGPKAGDEGRDGFAIRAHGGQKLRAAIPDDPIPRVIDISKHSK